MAKLCLGYSVFSIFCLAGSVFGISDTLYMEITTETDDVKFSDSNDCKVSVYLNDDIAGKVYLDNPGVDDFKLGATDVFSKLKASVPLQEIEKITFLVEGGGDAWRLKRFSIQFFQGDKKTDLISFPANISFSKEKSDRACKQKAVFSVRPPQKQLLMLK